MNEDEGRQRLAELAWERYTTAVKNEGQDRRRAFIDIVKTLLQQQDEAWEERTLQ